jgi:hypothetical protein
MITKPKHAAGKRRRVCTSQAKYLPMVGLKKYIV